MTDNSMGFGMILGLMLGSRPRGRDIVAAQKRDDERNAQRLREGKWVEVDGAFTEVGARAAAKQHESPRYEVKVVWKGLVYRWLVFKRRR